ncbi:hypothetical protein [Zavarzinella formosa]|uniref:hypothetical protein n=1 Tax=Zavarzinella formosa TaxID=360055 RepID=UPI0002FDDFAA|nr:hypothetical protein [Zavarzinella formosa]
MIGAIAGDVIGSVHEATATKTKRFPLFTPESCFTDGDADTLACIAGAVAGVYYGIPAEIESETLLRLDDPLREVVIRFRERFQSTPIKK